MERNEPDTSSIIGGKSAFHRRKPCKYRMSCVHHVEELGSHHMFVLLKVVAVQVDVMHLYG